MPLGAFPKLLAVTELCLRDAVDHVERVSEKLEAAENAAAGTFEPKD
jgi:hypothetical protein